MAIVASALVLHQAETNIDVVAVEGEVLILSRFNLMMIVVQCFHVYLCFSLCPAAYSSR